MSSLDEIKAHLHHEAHELRQGQTETRQALQLLHNVLSLLNAAGDRYRTAYADNRACNDLVDLISPAFNELMHDNHAPHDDMDRMYALRVATLGGHRGETGTRRTESATSNQPNQNANQRIQELESYIQLLKFKLNEMRDKYDSAIIDVVDLKDTVKSLQEASASKLTEERLAYHNSNVGSSTGPGASLDDNWIPQFPARDGTRNPIIAPLDLYPTTPSKVKSKLDPTVEAFAPSNSTGKHFAKTGSMQISPTITTTEKPSAKEQTGHQVTVATGAQDGSAKRAQPLQATSLTSSILPHLRRMTNVAKNADAHPSQVERSSKGKGKEDGAQDTELLSHESALAGMKENVKAATTPGAFVAFDPALQAWLDSQEKAQPTGAATQEPASVPDDTLIQIDPEDSPKAGEKKTVPLPPGFIPISTKDAPGTTETATPIETGQAASPTTAHDGVASRDPAAKNELTLPVHPALMEHWSPEGGYNFPVPPLLIEHLSTQDKKRNFMIGYDKLIDAFAFKWGPDPRRGVDGGTEIVNVDPAQYRGADKNYVPIPPTGTRELGSLLDAACKRLVLKPSAAANATEKSSVAAEGWKAIRKDGRVVFVL